MERKYKFFEVIMIGYQFYSGGFHPSIRHGVRFRALCRERNQTNGTNFKEFRLSHLSLLRTCDVSHAKIINPRGKVLRKVPRRAVYVSFGFSYRARLIKQGLSFEVKFYIGHLLPPETPIGQASMSPGRGVSLLWDFDSLVGTNKFLSTG